MIQIFLLKANDANNIRVENANGILTNSKGYAVLPYASIYKNNRVSLDINSLGENVELENAIMNVIPTKGALVQADFKTNYRLSSDSQFKETKWCDYSIWCNGCR
ncbi:hypothetical protein BHE89_17670 [Shigella sp. FC1967]|uniref:fimbria/pilus outer membrane usher protein n=1 Tax=Shigella sp. FC1967 TaxID=1898041 RepID=UPI00086B3F66|nr:fimbria/pilus outer membrane usher protein [Shigella sp. FC1967]OEJ07277.1 hypothetical protein BHE89_17670 [Shigella sp. FC1967]